MTEIIKTDKCKIIYRVEIYNIIQGNADTFTEDMNLCGRRTRKKGCNNAIHQK